jgi:hypothetical protein
MTSISKASLIIKRNFEKTVVNLKTIVLHRDTIKKYRRHVHVSHYADKRKKGNKQMIISFTIILKS